MRKLLIPLLLASAAAATPAIAKPDDPDRQQARVEHQQARVERSEVRAERAAPDAARPERFAPQSAPAPQFAGRPERPQFEARQAPQFAGRPERPQFEARPAPQFGGRPDRSQFEGRGNVTPQQVVQEQQRSYPGYRGGYAGQAQVQQDQRGGWSRDRGGYAGQVQVQQDQRGSGWSRDRGSWSQNRDGDFRQRQAIQQQGRDGSRWASGGTWNRDWRNDRRYDWRDYRNRHRSAFHIGIYYDPFGYGYQRFDIGYRLQSLYYGQRYWIDPAMYSLPYPPPGTEWVRYWNDALLVDVYTGEVIDMIPNFFW